MTRFLIYRPIAVFMSSMALLVIGLISSTHLPVSLLPDIDIPVILVNIKHPNMPAREMENNITKPIREQLTQLNDLKSIESETRDEKAFIKLKFLHGSDIDYAYLEASERIDDIIGHMPADFERPDILKVNASDLPVLYLNLIRDSLKNPNTNRLELSEFAETVIKRRLEQLPEVAMADISGIDKAELVISPDPDKMNILGIEIREIENIIRENNFIPERLLIRNGLYQYKISFSNTLSSIPDIAALSFKTKKGRIIRLDEIADIFIRSKRKKGLYQHDGKDAICLSIIKAPEARIADLRKSIRQLQKDFDKQYPGVSLVISRDQTVLLDQSINGLKQSLILAIGFSFLVAFLFMGDLRSPLIIGMTIPFSLLVSMILFYLLGISINILSLTGLILGVGMMVDNSIIVVDNIQQIGKHTTDQRLAAASGTNEVIRPLLSSVLTSSAVFLPLIFMSDLAGALFYDQALAVCISLAVSFFTSIMVLPVVYAALTKNSSREIKNNRLSARIEKLYETGLSWVFEHKAVAFSIFCMMIVAGIIMFSMIRLEGFPRFRQSCFILKIDWNENISLEENKTRVRQLLDSCHEIETSDSFIGEQDFLLNKDQQNNLSEAFIYIGSGSQAGMHNTKTKIDFLMTKRYPLCNYSFETPSNTFQQLFEDNKAPLIAEIVLTDPDERFLPQDLDSLKKSMGRVHPGVNQQKSLVNQTVVIEVDHKALLLYDVAYKELIRKLKSALNSNNTGNLYTNKKNIPLIIGESEKSLYNILRQSRVSNQEGRKIPLSALIDVSVKNDFRVLHANKKGQYYPVIFNNIPKNIQKLKSELQHFRRNRNINITLSGSYFENIKMIGQLGWILLVSLILLYLILAAQFESFLQPLIIIIEILFDISGALLFLLLFGASLNIMSGIGMIVMSGIIINDSILKIDAINRACRQAKDLMTAITTGGKRRVKPIIMTSLTTIFALLPILMFSGLGSELQIPLALSIIGGMLTGTFVSLFFIPLAYWFIKKV
ncbi:MAG: efflux RND transporter permease subunit [Bacteroidota bacterium]|nr:efflux RND transporter permease subunit [Bacteroidota bacterium]